MSISLVQDVRDSFDSANNLPTSVLAIQLEYYEKYCVEILPSSLGLKQLHHLTQFWSHQWISPPSCQQNLFFRLLGLFSFRNGFEVDDSRPGSLASRQKSPTQCGQ